MAMLAGNIPEAEHFADFHIHHVAYKTVDGQPIETSILVPKDAAPGPRPTIVRWHGGGLVRPHIKVEECWSFSDTSPR